MCTLDTIRCGLWTGASISAGGAGSVLPHFFFTRASGKPVTPDLVTRYDIEIRPILAALKPGHRLRLVLGPVTCPVSCSALPRAPTVRLELSGPAQCRLPLVDRRPDRHQSDILASGLQRSSLTSPGWTEMGALARRPLRRLSWWPVRSGISLPAFSVALHPATARFPHPIASTHRQHPLPAPVASTRCQHHPRSS